MARTSTILTSAEIEAVEYLASLSPNTAVVTNGSGFVISSSVTPTELGYLSGVTSAIQTQLNGKENSITAGTTAQYWRGDKTWQTLNTTAVTEGTNLYYTAARFNTAFAAKSTTDLAEGTNLYLTNARVIASTLTGYTSGAGTITSADTVLSAIQKLNGNIAAIGPTTGFTINRAMVSNASGVLAVSTVSTTQLQYLASATGTTGTTSSNLVFSTSPTLVTPVLGAATATGLKIGTVFVGAGASTIDTTHRGSLSSTAATELIISSFGVSTANESTLGISAYRISTGSDWQTTAMGLGMNVDAVIRAATSGVSQGLWFNPNGSISIGGTPLNTSGANFVVANSTSAGVVNTVLSSILNTGSGLQVDHFVSNAASAFFADSAGVITNTDRYVIAITGAAQHTSFTSVGVGIGTSSPTSPLHIHATPATNAAHILIEDLAGTNSASIEFKDAAGTPNRWLLGTGFTTFTDGVFFLYDRRQNADRLRVDTNGIVSINGATANKAILEVNGNVNLNNVYYPTTAALNPMYTIFRDGGTSYGMKLQYDTSAMFGTMIFSPAPSNFISLGVCTGTGTTDNDFISQVYLDSVSGNLGVRTTLGEIQTANAATFTVRQTNVNSAAVAPGWIAGSFGGKGGTGDVVVMGGYSNSAVIGAHNYSLTAWADLYINPAGGKVFVGPISSALALFEIGGGSVAGSALSTQFVCEAPNLGTTGGNENIIASFALNTGNTSSLGVSSYRVTSGTDWQTAAIGLSYNVDNTVRASTTGVANSIWFLPNGSLNVGSTPFGGTGGNLIVSGTTSSAVNTVFATIVNTGVGGSSLDLYSSSTGGYLGPSVGLSWGTNPFIFSIAGSEVMRISANGCVGIFDTSGDAFLHIAGGTTGFAPLKIGSGSVLTTPQVGAVEFSTDSLYITRTTNTTRQKINGLRTVLIRVVDSATNVATGTVIGGDVEIPITGVIASIGAYVDTAGTTGTMTIDVNKNGTTLMSATKITIDSTEKSSRTAATAPVLTTTTITTGDIITIDIDAIQTTPAKGLTVRLEIIEQ